jgi:hypothetical protein
MASDLSISTSLSMRALTSPDVVEKAGAESRMFYFSGSIRISAVAVNFGVTEIRKMLASPKITTKL